MGISMGCRFRSEIVLVAAALGAAAFCAPAAAQADGEIQFNEKFLGLISGALDQDVIQFEEAGGSKLTVTVTSQPGNQLKPSLALLDGSLAEIDVGGKLQLGQKEARIEGFAAPYSGTYYVRVGSANGLTGTYTCQVKGKVKKEYKATATIGQPGEIGEVAFTGRQGGKVSGTITRKSGDLIPTVIEIVGPNGGLVPIASKVVLNAAEDVVKIKNVKLPLLGEYRVRFTGQGGTTGECRVALKVSSGEPLAGKVYEDEFPGNPDAGKPGLTLSEVLFGRGLRTAEGLVMNVVSPLSVVQTDPISDLPVPGTLAPLFEGGSLNDLVNFNLGPLYGPPVVPRNAVLVLRFSREPDVESLNLDGDNVLTAASPVQVTVNGAFVPLEVFVQGKTLVLNPVVGDSAGFPGSPIAVDAAGNPTANVEGAGKLEILSVGANVLCAAGGGVYEPRADLLGSSDAGGKFIGFNPGNSILDFFQQSSAGPSGVTFAGFLPDLKAPRLIREYVKDEVFAPNYIDPGAGDEQGQKSLALIRTDFFNVFANGGKGEWARGILRLRPNGPNTEEHVIERNTVVALGGGLYRNTIELATKIVIPLASGQEFQLVRAEYFEPDLSEPLDPALYDPDNPQLFNNTELKEFVEVRDRFGVEQSIDEPVDPLATFTFRFSEPMQIESFRPYETLLVTDDATQVSADPNKARNYGLNYVGRVRAAQGGKAMTFSAEREVQFGASKGTYVPVGLGKTSALLRFHVVVVPMPDVLEGLLGSAGYKSFAKEGFRGVTDVGGQPLAYPKSMLSALDKVVVYSFPFITAADASLDDGGAVVQRFLGVPQTGFDAVGNTGVTYRDVKPELTSPQSNLYGPRMVDLNLFTNGFLSGAPVQFFTKIHDDFNPPPTGQFAPFPFGTSTPIGGFSVLGGARLQQIFRAVDCSPDWENLQGTNLDLIHMAYAPIGGFVQEATLPDISIHAGHSAVVPDTRQDTGIPTHPNSGLCYANSTNTNMNANYDAVELASGVAHQRQLVAGEPDPDTPGQFVGVEYNIHNDNLFAPIGTQHTYHPIPAQQFDHPFAYNNGTLDQKTFSGVYGGNQDSITWGGVKNGPRPESLLIEYRVTVKDPANPPATQNGFTFAVGVLSSALPRFRVFTIGTGCMSCCTATVGSAACAAACIIAYGPVMDGSATGGGNPLDPDLIVNAAGPAPAPPGLACTGLAAPQNHGLPPGAPPGCNDASYTNPNIEQVAYGQANNPDGTKGLNNFGDNSRYFMVFNYVKRESYILSPPIRVQPLSVTAVTYHAPIFDPPLDSIPEGSVFDVTFRSSPTGSGGVSATPWVTPEQMAIDANPINTHSQAGPYIQFQAFVEANTSTQLVPVFDDITVPFTVTGR